MHNVISIIIINAYYILWSLLATKEALNLHCLLGYITVQFLYFPYKASYLKPYIDCTLRHKSNGGDLLSQLPGVIEHKKLAPDLQGSPRRYVFLLNTCVEAVM